MPFDGGGTFEAVGTARADRYSGRELRSETRVECERRFERMLRRYRVPDARPGHWGDTGKFRKWADVKVDLAPRLAALKVEREANKLARRLQSMLLEAKGFAATERAPGSAIAWLRQMGELYRETYAWSDPADQIRVVVVETFDRVNLLRLPPARAGNDADAPSSQYLQPSDFAVLSILLGSWPSTAREPATPAAIIGLEAKAIAHAVKNHGRVDLKWRGPR